MWDVVPLEGATLEEVDSPRLVVDTCPRCRRRARMTERAVVREREGEALPWRAKEVVRRVLECEKCRACFALPDEGLPLWNEKPEERERNLKLANLRARWTVVTQEVARWRKRSDLAVRANDVTLADEARRVAARYEGEAHALRAEIERLGGELPRPPAPDPSEQKLDEELAAMREKAAAKKAAQETAAPGDKAPEAGDEAPPAQAPAAEAKGDAVDDELAALKRRVARKEPKEGPAGDGEKPPAPGDDDEVAALKRKLKRNN